MKTALKRLFALCLCCVMVATVVVPVSATTGFYDSCSTVAANKDREGCGSMQGMAVGSTYMYTAKINSAETKAILSKTNRKTGAVTALKDASTGKGYFTYLGHANGMDVCSLDGSSNLFVATVLTGSNSLVRLKVSGSKATKVGGYTMMYKGKEIAITGVAILSKTSTHVNLLLKKGTTFYTGSVAISAKSGTVELTKAFTLNTSDVLINGTSYDLSSWTGQDFGYHDNTIFVPLWDKEGNPGQSVIAVYDITNASGKIKARSDLSFRIIGKTYAALYEIESCGICPEDGKLYFNTNRRKSASDRNHDAVLVFKEYDFYGCYESYDTVAALKKSNGCGIMQGMAVGSTYMYTAQINDAETKAVIRKTNRNTGEVTILKDSSTGKSYFTYLAHANGMEVCSLDGYSNLFIVTTKTGSNSLVRLKVDGSKATKMGGYTLKYNGSDISMHGVSILSKTSTHVNLLFKRGEDFYTGSVKISAKSGAIELTKVFSINTANVTINGETHDLSSWTRQDFAYHDNQIFVPLWNKAESNQSVVLVYDITNASGTITARSDLSFWVTSEDYTMFEIESCGICSKDGKMYFNVNRRKGTDTNHDAVLVFEDYTY